MQWSWWCTTKSHNLLQQKVNIAKQNNPSHQNTRSTKCCCRPNAFKAYQSPQQQHTFIYWKWHERGKQCTHQQKWSCWLEVEESHNTSLTGGFRNDIKIRLQWGHSNTYLILYYTVSSPLKLYDKQRTKSFLSGSTLACAMIVTKAYPQASQSKVWLLLLMCCAHHGKHLIRW